MRAICAGIASAFDVEIAVEIRDIFSVLINQEEQSKVVEEVARTVVDPAKVFIPTEPKMGSEDFADICWRCRAPIFGSAMTDRCRCTIQAISSTTRYCRLAPACSPASLKPACRQVAVPEANTSPLHPAGPFKERAPPGRGCGLRAIVDRRRGHLPGGTSRPPP